LGGVLAYLTIPFKINAVETNFTGVNLQVVNETITEIEEEIEQEIDEEIEQEIEEVILVPEETITEVHVVEEKEEEVEEIKEVLVNVEFESKDEEEDYRETNPGPVKIYPKISPGREIISP
jgi:SMC interacting uncharacterized protein involved in chromosome segregation